MNLLSGRASLAVQTLRRSGILSSANYINDLYLRWMEDPKKVHPSWNKYFNKEAPRLTINETSSTEIERYMALNDLIASYRSFGHRAASIDPLGLSRADNLPAPPYGLDPSSFQIPPEMKVFGFDNRFKTVDELVKFLKRVYCETVGVQYMHLSNNEMRDWIRQRIEADYRVLDEESRLVGLKDLMRASLFEDFAAQKLRFQTAFYAKGCESYIPALSHVINQSNRLGVEDFVIGMAHRGRHAILCNILNCELSDFFKLFKQDLKLPDENIGDSKYHLGGYYEGVNKETGKPIRISLLSNASHLESVSSVAQGRVTALQHESGDLKGDKSLCILVHGDAALAGQGVVYEYTQATHVPQFTTNGIVHIVCNNQLGFTTERSIYSSTAYSTDVLRAVDTPVFHLNAEDVDSVLFASNLVAEFRNVFRKDAVVDVNEILVRGYRKFGHNEVDDPTATQPIMYKKIQNQEPVLSLYSEKCISDGLICRSEYEKWVRDFQQKLSMAYEAAEKEKSPKDKIWLDVPPCDASSKRSMEQTGVEKEVLDSITKTVWGSHDDTSFHMQKSVSRLFSNRFDTYTKSGEIDFAMGETLSFGSILLEGINIRITGQDSERGAFAHRHFVLHDFEDFNKKRVPLKELPGKCGTFDAINSPLCENAILGHQYGYSLHRPGTLCIWEAQYGDFANNAQCLIDQYVVSGAAKWHHESGLIMLLPHGLDGGGPEHSSSREERYLQVSLF
ncbi:hypothetical protein ACOME3_007951 [Neoechinorhynchus agilis]